MMRTLLLCTLLLLACSCSAEDPPCGTEGAECCLTCTGPSPCLPVRTCDEGLTCTITVDVEADDREFVCLVAP